MSDTARTPLLNEQICFALYSASRALTSRYRDLLEPLGITYPQYLVLVTLWVEGPQSVKDLGERMQLDSGTLSPLLARLERDGLVERQRSDADARVVRVRRARRVSHRGRVRRSSPLGFASGRRIL